MGASCPEACSWAGSSSNSRVAGGEWVSEGDASRSLRLLSWDLILLMSLDTWFFRKVLQQLQKLVTRRTDRVIARQRPRIELRSWQNWVNPVGECWTNQACAKSSKSLKETP